MRFWTVAEIEAALGTGVLTPNFEEEWQAYRTWCRHFTGAVEKAPGLCGGDEWPDLVQTLADD